MPLARSTRLGPYEVLAPLGAGAMGEVYRAHDSRLDRDVALKIISGEEVGDQRRRYRFEQEARAASSLNHPNIVSIFDLGLDSGTSYIVSELVEGESLRAVIDRGPVPHRALFNIGAQIAEGLAAAHAAGVIHRDLKPENIMVTPDQRVKILDFGLAKGAASPLAGLDANTSDEARWTTEPGLILGTVGYMSPEQATGHDVSIQSDQFALGCILHEMATGQPTFPRESPLKTLLAIANMQHAPFTPGPSGFRLLVDRCLSRDPSKRFSDTAEIGQRLRKFLRELPDEAESKTDSEPPPVLSTVVEQPPAVLAAAPPPVEALSEAPREKADFGFRWLALVLACAALIAIPLFWPKASTPEYRFSPLATEAGVEIWPAWSPDGGTVAYSGEVRDRLQIFLRQPQHDGVQLTHGDSDGLFPFWSADGRSVLYVSQQQLWRVGVLGGTPQLVADGVRYAAASPDGKLLALVRKRAGDHAYHIWFFSPDHRLTMAWSRDLTWPTFLQFAPDGRLSVWTQTERPEFWVIKNGDARPVSLPVALTGVPEPFQWQKDGRHILMAQQHLLEFGIARGAVAAITSGVAQEATPALEPRTGRIAFAAQREDYDVVQLSLSSGTREVLAGSSQREYEPELSPDELSLAFVTFSSGQPEIWLRQRSSGWKRPLVTADIFPNSTRDFSNLRFTKDGQRLCFLRQTEHTSELYSVSLAGTPPERIGDSVAGPFDLSPDGNWLVIETRTSGQSKLTKVSLPSGGRAELGVGEAPSWSPNGRQIAYRTSEGLFVRNTDGSSPRLLGAGDWIAFRWLPAGNLIYGLRREGDQLVLTTLSENGATTARAVLGPFPAAFRAAYAAGQSPLRGLSIAPDGQAAFTGWLTLESDLWLLEGRPQPRRFW